MASIGSFVALYRIILNALPLLFPANVPLRKNLRHLFARLFATQDEDGNLVFDDSPPSSPTPSPPLGPSLPLPSHLSPGDRREARLSSSAQIHQSWVRKKTRRWHSVLAGAVAGAVAISFEKHSRQVVIAQQLFVRYVLLTPLADQGTYFWQWIAGFIQRLFGETRFSHSTWRCLGFCARVRLTFFSPCSVLMSEKMWTDCVCIHFEPTHSPKVIQTLVCLGYHCVKVDAGLQHDRLSNLIHVPQEVISTHHNMVRHGTYDPADFAQILARPDLHPHNATLLEQWRTTLPPYASCAMSHPHVPRCLSVPQDRILSVARWTLPIYGALHFVPLLFFKRAAFMRAPARMALRAAWGTARSTAFLSVAVVIYQGWFCGMQNVHRALAARRAVVPAWLLSAVLSRPAHWMGGVVTGLSLFVEAEHRRGELAMYALPKGLESAWVALRGRGLVLHTGKCGNPLVRSFVSLRFCELCSLTLHVTADCVCDGDGYGA